MNYFSTSRIKERAQLNLANCWGIAIGVQIIASLIMSSIGFTSRNVDIMEILTLSISVSLAGLIMTSVLEMASIRFFLKMHDHQHGVFQDFIDGLKLWKKAIPAYLAISVFTFLWTLLLVIPGIIKAYAYSQTLYILADNPDMDIMEAIRESENVMEGNKMNLFILHLSFIGWTIASFLTCGIGFFFLAPYIAASEATFYREITIEHPRLGRRQDNNQGNDPYEYIAESW